jgi:hypothetical protein
MGKFTKNHLISANGDPNISNIFKEIKNKIESNQFNLKDKDDIIELKIRKDNNKSLILQMRKIKEFTYIKNKEEEFKNLIVFIDKLKKDYKLLDNKFTKLEKKKNLENNETKEF